jgi:uncharacterized protein with FMN-binding domain
VIYLTKGLKEISILQIENVTPGKLKDGNYTGKYEIGRWANEVYVTIKNHKIAEINVIKDATFSKP